LKDIFAVSDKSLLQKSEIVTFAARVRDPLSFSPSFSLGLWWPPIT